MRRRETHTLQSLDVSAGPQQLGERIPVADAVTERVDVLAEQRDLLGAFIHASANLRKDVAGTAVMLLATRGGHDAERARVVAADRDGYPARHLRSTGDRQLTGEIVQLVGHFDLAGPRHAGLIQQARQRADVLRAEHRIHPRRLLCDPLAVKLGHASADRDLHVRMRALEVRPQADGAVHAFRGVLPHRARVHDDQVDVLVRRLFLGRRDVSVIFEHTGDSLGIMHVHLASQRVHVKYALAAPRCGAKGRVRQCGGALRLGHHVFVHSQPS